MLNVRPLGWDTPQVGVQMNNLALVLVFTLSSTLLQTMPFRSPIQIIQEEGQFLFIDGSSYYLFRRDGSFTSNPLGIAGRTIVGHWIKDSLGGCFIVEGKWGWINGLQPVDRYRRMKIYIGSADTFKQKETNWPVEDPGPAKIYNCYFEIEELIKIPTPESG
jgi:hypothetical protein